MSDRQGSEQPFGLPPPEDWAYKKIAELVDGIIADACVRHYDCTTQEHQLTSRLAEALERELNRVQVGGLRVEVRAQELPDRGSGSLEKPIGADLYISVVIDGRTSKGILVQSKWDASAAGGREQLHAQVRKMLGRSDESYVFVYEPSGISVFPATDVLGDKFDRTNVTTVGNLMADACKCEAGDRDIGRNPELPPDQSLRQMLNELAVDAGIAVDVVSVLTQ
jgi:hypothetical protein